MNEAELIKGKNRLSIFEQLKKSKTLVKMHISKKDFDRLTIITDVLFHHTPPLFRIDYPEGFREAIAGIGIWQIEFEFTGKNNIQYAFTTVGGEIFNDGIWIRFPDTIKRIQRRKYFRIKPSSGTKIYFKMDNIDYEFIVSDISLGGSLGLVAVIGQEDHKKIKLSVGDILINIILISPSEDKYIRVSISKASVIRIEKSSQKAAFRYAIHFIEMNKNEEKVLTELIYQTQREFLRERIPINDIE